MFGKADGSKSDLPPYQDQLDRSLVSNTATSEKRKENHQHAFQVVSTDEIQIEENEFRSPTAIAAANRVLSLKKEQEVHEIVEEIEVDQM